MNVVMEIVYRLVFLNNNADALHGFDEVEAYPLMRRW